MTTAVIKSLPYCTHRYALFVSYIGTKYQGSQRQANRNDSNDGLTIQDALDNALEVHLPKSKVSTLGISRTDKGVHAIMNIFTLIPQEIRHPTEKLKTLLNNSLMDKCHDIKVNEVILIPSMFDPKIDVDYREYVYKIGVLNEGLVQSIGKVAKMQKALAHYLPITELYRMLVIPRLNHVKLDEAIGILNGQHDFASFSKRIEVTNTVKNIEISVSYTDIDREIWPTDISYICNLSFKSKSFLYNQIRKMVGCILAYASYEQITQLDIKRLLDKPSPSNYYPLIMAEPWGLYLTKIGLNLDSKFI